MSYQGHTVVAVIPAGRQRVMDPLLKHLRTQSLIDEIHLWQNTEIEEDLAWMRLQADDKVTLIPLDTDGPPRNPKQLNTGRFYQYATNPGTLYIRFDDDIVWLHPDAVRNLITARLENSDPFVVFATIWNNAVISSIESKHLGAFGMVGRYCMDPIGWKLPEFGEYAHRVLLDHIRNDTTTDLYFPHQLALTSIGYRPPFPLRFSVSCFIWHGEDMAEVADELWSTEEEQFISYHYPERTGRINLIAGNALVSHYSFFTQRAHLDTTDILGQYVELAEGAYHDAYYQLLEAGA